MPACGGQVHDPGAGVLLVGPKRCGAAFCFVCIARGRGDEPNLVMAATKEQVRDRNRRISKMRIAALFGLPAVMLAVIVTVAPQATVMTSEVSAEAVVIDFFGRPAPVQTAARSMFARNRPRPRALIMSITRKAGHHDRHKPH